MRVWRTPFAAVLLTCLACTAQSTKPPEIVGTTRDGEVATLTVEIGGLESDEGSVAVALFDSSESFDQRTDAVASHTVAPRDGLATWTVAELPAGIYAVAVFHDLNDNGELDRTTLGPPAEPYGFSNDVRGTFGPPGFDKAAFELPPGSHTIQIQVR